MRKEQKIYFVYYFTMSIKTRTKNLIKKLMIIYLKSIKILGKLSCNFFNIGVYSKLIIFVIMNNNLNSI